MGNKLVEHNLQDPAIFEKLEVIKVIMWEYLDIGML